MFCKEVKKNSMATETAEAQLASVSTCQSMISQTVGYEICQSFKN